MCAVGFIDNVNTFLYNLYVIRDRLSVIFFIYLLRRQHNLRVLDLIQRRDSLKSFLRTGSSGVPSDEQPTEVRSILPKQDLNFFVFVCVYEHTCEHFDIQEIKPPAGREVLNVYQKWNHNGLNA
jgi:hypothetical protein